MPINTITINSIIDTGNSPMPAAACEKLMMVCMPRGRVSCITPLNMA